VGFGLLECCGGYFWKGGRNREGGSKDTNGKKSTFTLPITSGHRRCNNAGTDAVHADAVRSVVEGVGAREGDYSCFRCAIRRCIRACDETELRSYVHYAASSLLYPSQRSGRRGERFLPHHHLNLLSGAKPQTSIVNRVNPIEILERFLSARFAGA
jgi:hypothetical protein